LELLVTKGYEKFRCPSPPLISVYFWGSFLWFGKPNSNI
jgi:hypothetical protein